MRPSQRLARSAVDATRFTQTSPHAYSRSSAVLQSTASHTEAPSSSFQANVPPRSMNQHPPRSPPPSSSQRPTETPAQKVARLRAEHIKNRQPKLTLWEKTVLRGRVIADKAHFVTAVFLISLTVVAGVVTVFSLSDMILYNRRKRRAFFAEQNALQQAKLVEAKEILARNGELDDDQRLLLNRERIALEAERERRERKGIWDIIKGAFSNQGLKVEEGREVRTDAGESVRPSEEATATDSPAVIQEQPMQPGLVLKSVVETSRIGERESERTATHGDPLDQLANNATAEAMRGVEGVETRSWFGWLSGR